MFSGDQRAEGIVLDTRAWSELDDFVEPLQARPMLRSALRRNGSLEAAPPAVRARLDADYIRTLARNMQLLHETRAVLDELRAKGIEALPLKGMALFLGGVPRDLGARPTSDIDILTWPRDRAGVVEYLLHRGYHQLPTGGAKHLPPFVRGGFAVEVHECAYWDLHDPPDSCR